MSLRLNRINILLQQEISKFLRTAYQEESVRITIVRADVSPDLRNAVVYFAVFGDQQEQKKAEQFLNKHQYEFFEYLKKNLSIKYIPKLKFFLDTSIESGTRLLNILDDLEDSH